MHLASNADRAAGDEDDLAPAAHQRVQLLHQRAQAAQRQPVVRVPRHHRGAHLSETCPGNEEACRIEGSMLRERRRMAGFNGDICAVLPLWPPVHPGLDLDLSVIRQ